MAEQIIMPKCKRIAVVAHNNKKKELVTCLKQYRDVLSQHKLFGTGTTGSLVEQELNLPVTKLRSGPLGGDQQLGSMIASQQLDVLLFLIDPLDSHPHNADVQALLRLAQVWGIVSATTATSIDFILTSPKINEPHTRHIDSTPVLPTITKTEHKSTPPPPPPPLQTRRVPVMNEKSKIKLPHILPTRRYILPPQTVLKNIT